MRTRLDRYILGEVIGPFLGGIVFFLFIFLMFQLLRLAELFIIHGIPTPTLLKMIALMCMNFLPTALPIAFLIAVLVGFGRLSADSELVAMKASGIGIFRLSLPITIFALLVVLLGVGLNLEWVPWSQRTFKSTLIRVSNTKIVSSIKEGAFTSGFFDLLIFADKVDTKTNRLTRVFLYDEREPKNPLTVVASSGEIVPVKTGSDLSAAAILKLYDGSIHRNDAQENTYQKIDFGEYRLYLRIDEGDAGMSIKPEYIAYRDLVHQIQGTTTATYEGRELRGEYWRRISVALTPLLFVFLGVGFGTVRTRAVRAGAALIAIVTLLVYYGLQVLGTICVQKGSLPPVLAMEIPNLAVLIAGIFSFRRASW